MAISARAEDLPRFVGHLHLDDDHQGAMTLAAAQRAAANPGRSSLTALRRLSQAGVSELYTGVRSFIAAASSDNYFALLLPNMFLFACLQTVSDITPAHRITRTVAHRTPLKHFIARCCVNVQGVLRKAASTFGFCSAEYTSCYRLLASVRGAGSRQALFSIRGMVAFFILMLMRQAATVTTAAFITHPLPTAAQLLRCATSSGTIDTMLSMVTERAPQPTVLDLLNEESFKSITKYFENWDVDDYLVVTEDEIEVLMPKEHLSTGYKLFNRIQGRKSEAAAKTVHLVYTDDKKPRTCIFTGEDGRADFVRKAGACGLIAEGADKVLRRKLAELEEGGTYVLDFSSGSSLHNLQDSAKAAHARIGHQATAWENQCKLAIPRLFADEGTLTHLEPCNIKCVPVAGGGSRRIDGVFYDREANVVVLLEARNGPMELSGYHTLEALRNTCDTSTAKQLHDLSDWYADVHLFRTARAVEANIGRIGGNAATSIKMVLAPELLEGHNLSDARHKQEAGAFYFLCRDGDGVSLGVPIMCLPACEGIELSGEDAGLSTAGRNTPENTGKVGTCLLATAEGQQPLTVLVACTQERRQHAEGPFMLNTSMTNGLAADIERIARTFAAGGGGMKKAAGAKRKAGSQKAGRSAGSKNSSKRSSPAMSSNNGSDVNDLSSNYGEDAPGSDHDSADDVFDLLQEQREQAIMILEVLHQHLSSEDGQQLVAQAIMAISAAADNLPRSLGWLHLEDDHQGAVTLAAARRAAANLRNAVNNLLPGFAHLDINQLQVPSGSDSDGEAASDASPPDLLPAAPDEDEVVPALHLHN
ncbi:hypothetical protein JKP88DRAFT_249408 [Tribonema minus]|uniref:Uncharacterized protein n=1 Tax=Tribonema minus TaxID=303371 RepID=A0A835YLF6_9STRA|nr:hypothetical protein JKP88DRAFT_249408 [Tribonema minus]